MDDRQSKEGRSVRLRPESLSSSDHFGAKRVLWKPNIPFGVVAHASPCMLELLPVGCWVHLVYNSLERLCPPTWTQKANGTPKWQDLPMLLKQHGSMPGLSGAFSTMFLPAMGLSLVLARPHGEEGSAMLSTPMPRSHQMSLLEPQDFLGFASHAAAVSKCGRL